MEKRKHTRLPIHLNAEISFADGRVCYGVTKNLSFGGAYIQSTGHEGVRESASCHLLLILQEGVDRAVINLKCEIVRTGKAGLGMRFLGIDMECYQHFKQLMVNHSPDPELLLAELSSDPGLTVHEDDGTGR